MSAVKLVAYVDASENHEWSYILAHDGSEEMKDALDEIGDDLDDYIRDFPAPGIRIFEGELDDNEDLKGQWRRPTEIEIQRLVDTANPFREGD